MEWSSVAGIRPSHPYVGGPNVEGLGANDVDRGRSRIVTTPDGQIGPASGTFATDAATDMQTVALLEGWRDIYNFRGSPMPWLLLLALVFLGLMQFRLQARAGRRVRLDAALG